jgi:DNA-binding LacI/PurR family transcriptional regulator
VARRAGVSYQTVSRVLNASPKLRPETRDRVLAVIDELGYQRNEAARVLGTSRSGMIGVLVASRVAAYGVQTITYAIETAARDAGYRIAMTSTDSDADSVRRGLEQLVQQSAEAVIVVAPHRRAFEALAGSTLRVPFVTLDSTRRDDGHSVSVDQFLGARLATRHLLDLGHERIVHLAGPQDWIEAEARMQGHLFEMSEADAQVTVPILGDWTADFGYLAGRELVRRRDFTAVFAANDQMALGLLHALSEAGLTVPGDVSVVGFDDIPEAAHLSPPLTTVRQDFEGIGRRAVDVLVAELDEDREVGVVEPLRPQLVLRASTGNARV